MQRHGKVQFENATGNHKCEGMSPHNFKGFRVGILNVQRMILRVKTHWIEDFLIPLKNF
jgi:hypothetical protein